MARATSKVRSGRHEDLITMLFNSIDFAIFLPVVFLFYWAVPRDRLRMQNLLIVVASYVFYGWWDARFLGLLALSTVMDFLIGRRMGTSTNTRERRLLLLISVLLNLGILIYFKYANFFLASFVDAFSFLGTPLNIRRLSVILPVGISFYTFQTLSYTIDVYRGHLPPTRDPIAFAAFVSFFPQLVAGPIERAAHLLPQMLRPRSFDRDLATDGLRQMLWGLFKKVVIADNLAPIADGIFASSDHQPGSMLLLGVLCFAFQIYGDFSGYSDIAIGSARLFGFDLMRNFNFPYFSRSIAEFWRRWHISLSTWLRDYLYMPLGGGQGGARKRARNLLITFLVSGLWHGANWTFVVWGLLNALYMLPSRRRGPRTTPAGQGRTANDVPRLTDLPAILGTFSLTLIAWVFFRAQDLGHAWRYLGSLFSPSLFSPLDTDRYAGLDVSMAMLAIMLVLEWHARREHHALASLGTSLPRGLRWAGYYALIACLFLFGGKQQDFIYFQF